MATIYNFEDFARGRGARGPSTETLLQRPGYILLGYTLDSRGWVRVYWMPKSGPCRVVWGCGFLDRMDFYRDSRVGSMKALHCLLLPGEDIKTCTITRLGRELLLDPKGRDRYISSQGHQA
jgi:hypothetical protein